MSKKHPSTTGQKPKLLGIDSASGKFKPRPNAATASSLGDVVSKSEALVASGQIEAAEALYAAWLGQKSTPGRHLALFNQAALLQQLGRFPDAIAAYKEGIVAQPDFGQNYVNLGLMLERAGQANAAIEVWAEFVGRQHLHANLDPQIVCTALNHIGRVQEGEKNYPQAAQALRESLEIDPKQSGVVQHWVHIRQKSCAWPVFEPVAQLSAGELMRCTSPLAMLALTDEPLHLFSNAQAFTTRTYTTKEQWIRGKAALSPKPRLRVGLVSGDFRQHAVGFLLPSLLKEVDRTRYELIAFDFSKHEASATRSEILSCFDKVLSIHQVSDQTAAEGIAHEEIDVLIDLHGLSAGARPEIFAFHPAPVQATYLGFIGSTTLPWFDHVIVDHVCMPPELEGYFSEKPVFMPGSFIPLTREVIAGGQETRKDLGLPEDSFVMAAFSNVYKITEEAFDCWLQLLQAHKDAVLWLIDDNAETTSNLKREAQARGADLSRLVFMPRCDHDTFKQRLKLADIYLDTYPYNCGSTSNDVINAGLPLVTRYGKTMISRMGLSILTELGQPQLACDSWSNYRATVRELHQRHHTRHPVHYAAPPVKGKLNAVLEQLASGTATPRRELHGANRSAASPITHSVLTLSKRGAAAAPWNQLQEIQALLYANQQAQDAAISFIAPTQGGLSEHDRHSLLQMDAHNRIISWGYPDAAMQVDINALMGLSKDQPQITEIFHAFTSTVGLDVSLSSWCVPAHHTLRHLRFTAPKWFWIQWLDIAQAWRDFAEQGTSKNQEAMTNIHDLLPNLVFLRQECPVKAHEVISLARPTLSEKQLADESARLAFVQTGNDGFLSGLRTDKNSTTKTPRARRASKP